MPDKQEIPIAKVPEDLRLEYESRVALDGPRFKHRITYLIERIARSQQALAELQTQLSQEKERSTDDWKRLNRVFKSTSDKTIDQDMQIERLQAENARLTEALRVKEEECDRLRDRERDVCAAVTRQCDVKKINEIMQDTLKARDDRALLAARRTQERGKHAG